MSKLQTTKFYTLSLPSLQRQLSAVTWETGFSLFRSVANNANKYNALELHTQWNKKWTVHRQSIPVFASTDKKWQLVVEGVSM